MARIWHISLSRGCRSVALLAGKRSRTSGGRLGGLCGMLPACMTVMETPRLRPAFSRLVPLVFLLSGCAGHVEGGDDGGAGGSVGVGGSASGGSAAGGSATGGGATGGSATGGSATGGSGSECVDGETRGEWCSFCTCEAGQWLCLATPCPPPECADGETMTDGCNTCSCTEGLWTCTERACPPAQCVEGEAMNDGCNTCLCAEGQWACTNRACPPPECTDGDTTDDGCNTCTCSGGQWACTELDCVTVGCGGWLGNTCADNEYCAYVEGELCGATDASSTCKLRPETCTTDENPVCGCDGMTYSNDCEAAAAGTGVMFAGACQ